MKMCCDFVGDILPVHNVAEFQDVGTVRNVFMRLIERNHKFNKKNVPETIPLND